MYNDMYDYEYVYLQNGKLYKMTYVVTAYVKVCGMCSAQAHFRICHDYDEVIFDIIRRYQSGERYAMKAWKT